MSDLAHTCSYNAAVFATPASSLRQPSRECVLGADIGTTGARAVAFDLQGRQLHAVSADYPLHNPHPGWAEQDPNQVCEGITRCVRQIGAWAADNGYRPRALGLSAILHSLIPIDRTGDPLGPSIIWADTRSVAEAEEIKQEIDPLALYRRVGGPVHPMYSTAKLRWLRRHRPDVYQRAAAFVGIKEFVVRRWTGQLICDRSVASGTGLYNGMAGAWDDQALLLAGITAGQLPPVIETTAKLDITPAQLRDLGLPEDCALIAGAGDGVLQTIGTGCVSPGQMVAMVATSGAIRSVVDRFQTDPKARTWCYYLADDRWVVGTAINNGGLVYAWLRDQLAGAALDARTQGVRRPAASGGSGDENDETGAVTLEDLNRWAAEVPPGSNGLVFLPYLAGERSPNWNGDARGLLFGLSLAHDYRHLARATLEGVGYRMRTIFEPMEEVAGAAHEIRAAGGFIRSPLWLQIVSDILGRPLRLVESPEASALGAAQLAMRGAGIVKRFEDLAPMVSPAATVEPDRARHALHSRLYEIYQRLYAAAVPEFTTIARLQAELSRNST
jgi:gluconokinase